MAMPIWQRLVGSLAQRSGASGLLPAVASARGHPSFSVSPCHHPSVIGSVDRVGCNHIVGVHQGPEIQDLDEATTWNPFMQLMAMPKRKVSPSRKGIRNGPKALKPVPVVAKCKACGRIKLPQFYCCSGEAKVSEQK